MVLKDVMDFMGSTNARLREVCTTLAVDKSKPLSGEPEDWRRVPKAEREELRKEFAERRKNLEADYRIRELLQNDIQRHLEEGMTNNLRNYKIYAAVDMAMDSSPINKFTMPLMMYAQGKINVQECATQLRQSGCPDTAIQRENNQPSGKVIGIDMPRFVDFSMNLVKSTVRRRVAAQTNKYSNQWPYLKCEPRGSDQLTRLRADATSTLMDIMVDDYGIREHVEQVIRYGLMYARCVDFKMSGWEYEAHPRFVGDTKQLTTEVTKQGISLFNPHPTRFGYDAAHQLSTINTDNGCEWLFYWDICRYRSILDTPGYFNVDQVSTTTKPWQLYYENQPYFNLYLDTVVVPPSIERSRLGVGDNPGVFNDRQLSFGLYTQDDKDTSVFKCEYYRKIIPSQYRIGDYSGPAWVRFTATSDGTIIGAEFLYSRPAAYLGIDEDENRLISPSMAMELLHFQDAMTNLVTQMLLLSQLETMTIIGINVDAFQESTEGKAMVDEIRRRLKGQNWYGDPHVIEYSLSKIKDLFGDDASAKQAVIDIKQASVSTNIQTVFNAMLQLLALMDRMLTMSPAETGQPAPREISATEVVAINNSTSTVYDAISNNIDTYRAAIKRMLYESSINCWQGEFRLPLEGRYTDALIEKAGFKAESSEEIYVNGKSRMTVLGLPTSLLPEHSYIFTSRDGAERPSNVQAAQAMSQTLQFILQVPQLVEALGKDKLFEIVNEIFRMAGATVGLNLSLDTGEDNKFQESEIKALQELVVQLQQALNQIMPVLEEMDGKLAEQTQINANQEEALGLVNQLANQVQTLGDRQDKAMATKPPDMPKLDYSLAPPSVQAQMEIQHGLVPATADERMAFKRPFEKGAILPPPA